MLTGLLRFVRLRVIKPALTVGVAAGRGAVDESCPALAEREVRLQRGVPRRYAASGFRSWRRWLPTVARNAD
jgi:hypothetical protein